MYICILYICIMYIMYICVWYYNIQTHSLISSHLLTHIHNTKYIYIYIYINMLYIQTFLQLVPRSESICVLSMPLLFVIISAYVGMLIMQFINSWLWILRIETIKNILVCVAIYGASINYHTLQDNGDLKGVEKNANVVFVSPVYCGFIFCFTYAIILFTYYMVYYRSIVVFQHHEAFSAYVKSEERSYFIRNAIWLI